MLQYNYNIINAYLKRRTLMKKKYLAILIAACMVAMAVGCADEENATSSEGTEMTSEASDGDAQIKEEPAAEATVAAGSAIEATVADNSVMGATVADVDGDMASKCETLADAFEYGTTAPETALENGYWEGYLLSSYKDKAGTLDEYGRVLPVIYEASIEGDTIKVTGVLTQSDPNVIHSALAASENTTHEFKIDDSTVFQKVDSAADPVIITKERFEKLLGECIDTWLTFEVEMENGTAKTVTFYA